MDDSLGSGGDLWQATYPVDNPTLDQVFDEFDDTNNFAILFDSDLYESIEWVDTPINSDISIEEPLTSDEYIQFSFNDNAESFDVYPFSIQFIWLGDGDPDSQAWIIYSEDFDSPIEAAPDSYGDVNITEINRLPEPTKVVAVLPAILMLLLDDDEVE